MVEKEVPIDIDMEAPLKKMNTKRKKQEADEVTSEDFTASYEENHNEGEFSQKITPSEFKISFEDQEIPQGITVSEFDYSVENHFKAVDTISTLCGETRDSDSDESESIKFLREWKQFSYPSRTLRFISQNESNMGRDFVGTVTLPQFSSASVPKKSVKSGEITSESRKDFVMHVGGLVSALDWCPRVHSHSNSEFRSEFIAVAAHPFESSYHRIGEPVEGQGMVQIWCVLISNRKKSLEASKPKKQKQRETCIEKSSEPKRPLGRPRKHPVDTSKNSAEKRPRGRPRKNFVDAISKSSEQVKPQARGNKTTLSNNHDVKIVASPLEDSSTRLIDMDLISKNGQLSEDCEIVKEMTNKIVDTSVCKKLKVKESTRIQDAENTIHMPSVIENVVLPSQDIPTLDNFPDTIGCDSIPVNCSAPDDVALPRLIFCLAHNGKVAWDLKWRPSGACDQRRMGNLAVLLGNGGLEVWEVPFPRTINSIYSNSQKDTTDPRFIKLQPVFRCSTIKYGDRQSIPLSLEWSTSSPHDKILIGCHDGTVALWKFCATNSLEETRPLLCFTADTVPIRTLSWAPVESSSEGSNVVVTGSLKGLMFWDLRDPFSPLWAINPFQQMIYSLDWVPDPRCIIVAFEDGTLKILNLLKGASDVPAITGEPFVGTQQKGYNSYYCSQFSIWSVHVSRLTGMVAYCGVDGTALYFKLTTKAVGSNPTRNRAPRFLCGMLMEEESTLTMLTPLSNIPFPMKKTDSEWAQTPKSKQGFISCSNQEKRLKEKLENVQRSNEQPLALCYNSDAELEFGTNDEAKTNIKNEEDKRFESLPPKMVALHKVRWNVNVGSENWLCYGGAAGVLRCQEMDTI